MPDHLEKYYRVAVLEEEPDPTVKQCFDCLHCKAAVSWWCTNKIAIRERGTSLPTGTNCRFWQPAYTIRELNDWYEQEMKEYQAIPFWKRIFVRKPVPPMEQIRKSHNMVFIPKPE